MTHVSSSSYEQVMSGVDLVDGTPILDIKPYIPSYDAPFGGARVGNLGGGGGGGGGGGIRFSKVLHVVALQSTYTRAHMYPPPHMTHVSSSM